MQITILILYIICINILYSCAQATVLGPKNLWYFNHQRVTWCSFCWSTNSHWWWQSNSSFLVSEQFCSLAWSKCWCLPTSVTQIKAFSFWAFQSSRATATHRGLCLPHWVKRVLSKVGGVDGEKGWWWFYGKPRGENHVPHCGLVFLATALRFGWLSPDYQISHDDKHCLQPQSDQCPVAYWPLD